MILMITLAYIKGPGQPSYLKIINLVILATESLLPWKVSYSQVWGIRTWTPLGGHYFVFHKFQSLVRMWRNWNSHTLGEWEYKLAQPFWKTHTKTCTQEQLYHDHNLETMQMFMSEWGEKQGSEKPMLLKKRLWRYGREKQSWKVFLQQRSSEI